MTEPDLAPLHSILAEYAPKGRPGLLPALHAAQAIYGYLPEAVAAEVGRTPNLPPAGSYGGVGFFTMFYPPPNSPLGGRGGARRGGGARPREVAEGGGRRRWRGGGPRVDVDLGRPPAGVGALSCDLREGVSFCRCRSRCRHCWSQSNSL